eukprot:363108-Chlamydomonas_euryale.AAC.6
MTDKRSTLCNRTDSCRRVICVNAYFPNTMWVFGTPTHHLAEVASRRVCAGGPVWSADLVVTESEPACAPCPAACQGWSSMNADAEERKGKAGEGGVITVYKQEPGQRT